MKPFQKIIAALLAVILVGATAGCVPASLSKQWSYKYDDSTLSEELDIGVYIYALYQAYNSALTYAQKSDDYKENEPFMDIEIKDDDGNKAVASEWIKDEADKIVMNLIALDYLVEKDGATWDEASMESAEKTAQDTWDMGAYASYGYYSPMSDELEPFGVSFESFNYSSYQANVKQTALFAKLYDKGGLEEVSDQELTDYFTENYVDYSYIPVKMYTSSTDSEGNSTSTSFGEKKINKIVGELEDYAQKLSNGKTDFDKVAKSCEKDYDTATDDEVKAKVSTLTDLENDNADIAKAVKKLGSNKAKVITVGKDGDSPTAYLVVKNNIKDDISEYIENDTNRSSVLSNMKSEDITELLEKTGKKLKKSDALTVNEGAVNRYDPGMFFAKKESTEASDGSGSSAV